MTTAIQVEAGQVELLLGSVERALAPASLEGFLRDEARPYLQERAEHRFDGQGDDVVGKWDPLAEKTIELHGPHEPNVLTGDLESYITRSPGRTGQQPLGASLELPGPGSSLNEKKVKVAQRGLNPNPIASFRPVPPRPVVGLNDRDMNRIVRSFGSYLERELRGDLGWVG